MRMLGPVLFALLGVGSPASSGSPIALHIEEVEDVAPQAALDLAAALRSAVENVSGRTVVLDDPEWASSCGAADRCIMEIRYRTRAEDLIMLRVYGGPLNIHLAAELLRSTTEGKTQQANLPRDPKSWTPLIEDLARALFPDRASPRLVPPNPVTAFPGATSAKTEEGRGFRSLPWILFGASAVAIGLGFAFGIGSVHARDRLDNEVLQGREQQELSDRLDRDKLAANLLFGTAAVGIVGGVLALVID